MALGSAMGLPAYEMPVGMYTYSGLAVCRSSGCQAPERWWWW